MGKASFFEDYLNEKYSDFVEQTVAEVKPEVTPDMLYSYEFRVGWVNPVSAPQEYAFFRKIENVFRHSSAIKEFETFCQTPHTMKTFDGKLMRSRNSQFTYQGYRDENEDDSEFREGKINRIIVVKFSLHECKDLQVYLFLYHLLAGVCGKFPRTSRFDSLIRARIRLIHNPRKRCIIWQAGMNNFGSGKNEYEEFCLLELMGYKCDGRSMPSDIFRWQCCHRWEKQIVERTKWINGHYELTGNLYATKFTCERYSHLEWLDSISIETKAQTWRELCLKMKIAKESLNYIDWFTSGNHSLKRFINKHLIDDTEFVEDIAYYLENYPIVENVGLSNVRYRNAAKKIGQYALDNSRSKKMSQYCKLIEQGIGMLHITLDHWRVIIDDSAVPCMMLDFKETE